MKITAIVILVVGIALIARVLTYVVEASDLSEKLGKINNAHCVEYKDTSGVKFLVNYFGENEEDFIILPKHMKCESVLSKFIGGSIRITYYKNTYFGVYLNGEEVRNTDSELTEFSNKTSSVIFISFITIFTSLLFYLKGRHITNHSARTR